MRSTTATTLFLALAVDLLLLAALFPPGSARPLVLTPPPPQGPPPAPKAEDARLARLTADDVARGLWGLAEAGALAPEQQQQLAPLVAAAGATRSRVGELRTRFRTQQAALVAAGAALHR